MRHERHHIRVMMHNDRLEIRSPGTLPNMVTLENMRYTHWSRNPIIARTLVEFGWVRELNEGVQRIYDEMAEMLLREPTYSEPNGVSVRLVLENSITSRMLRRGDSMASDLGEDVYRSLDEYELAALQYVYGRGRVTAKELAEYLGRSVKVSRPALKSLVEKKILDWHGNSTHDPRPGHLPSGSGGSHGRAQARGTTGQARNVAWTAPEARACGGAGDPRRQAAGRQNVLLLYEKRPVRMHGA